MVFVFLSHTLRLFLHTRRCFQKERKEKKHNVCVQATILVTFVETLSTLCHLQNWFMYYGFANKQGSQRLGKKRKSKHREKLDDKSVEKAWHEKSSVSVKWFNEIWQVLLCPCSNWKNLKYMGRQQHNVGASNRPASYPRHQHFGLKIGTVSSFYCGHPWDSKLVSATAKVMVEVHFRQNL